MNLKNSCRGHFAFLIIIIGLFFLRPGFARSLIILGDSLSAGYQLPAEQIWASRLAERLPQYQIINASISGDTTAQGLSRLPQLLQKHQPKWVFVELGANDGLRGFPLTDIEKNLIQIITQVKQAKAQPILMQIRIPPNYGRRYNDSFMAIYPRLAKDYDIPLLPFYLEEVIGKPEWMLADGIHPNEQAQGFITDWMMAHLVPLLK